MNQEQKSRYENLVRMYEKDRNKHIEVKQELANAENNLLMSKLLLDEFWKEVDNDQ